MLYTELALDERLQRALATAGFVSPTPIQAAALPVAMAGRDLLGTAQTGTGKTAAFVLPILHRIVTTPLDTRKTRAVILAPTRELAEQILAVVRELGVHTNVRAVAVYGGVAMQQQTRALRNGVEIVIACPGRLLDHIKRRNTDFSQLDFLVLDEADRMLDMGFMPSIEEIVKYVPDTRQTLLFSATFAKSLNSLVQRTMRNPERVAVDTAVAAQTVHHTLYQVKASLKMPLLTNLLRKLIPESDSVLIFTRTRLTANQVAEHLEAMGMDADVLHAEKTQRARQDTLDRYRSGEFPYLVATDIAARGIDVASISHVINFDLPAKVDDYLHRIGRTGRMERPGQAISLVTKGDMRTLREIERMLGKRMDVAQMEGCEDLRASAPVVHHAIPHAPKPHVATHVTNRPAKPHHHRNNDERSRRAPHGHASMEPVRRADRPYRQRDAEAAPRTDRPYRQRDAEAAPRADRPYRQRDAEAAPRADRPYRHRDAEAAPRADRPYRQRDAEAAPRADRPYRHRDAEAAPRADRPYRQRDTDTAPRADRPYRQRDTAAAAAPARNERPRKPFGNERPTGRLERPERAERRYRDGDSSPAPRRGERPMEARFDAATTDAPRRERPSGKPFTGMASAAKHQRKHAGGKRQPGEVGSGARAGGKTGPTHHSSTTHGGRAKPRAGYKR